LTNIFIDTILYFSKYIIGFVLLFVIVPGFIFTNIKSDMIKSTVANYIKIVFWIVIFGYIAILFKLYEFITIFIVALICIFYKYFKRNIMQGNMQTDIREDVGIIVIDHVDNVERIEDKLIEYVASVANDLERSIRNYFSDIWSLVGFIILCVVFAYSGYLRFYDSFVNVAPISNEAYLTLTSMKYLGSRILFNDGIYPQGFYIVLETLQKILQIDHIYIVNFSGALNSMLVTFGIYYFISKISGNRASGIVGAAIYGCAGFAFLNSPSMQVVANPQQFALIFVLPVLYFFYEYINQSKREDFFVALFGCALIGLIHPLILVFLIIGLLALCFANILRDIRNALFKTLEVFIVIGIALMISALPIVIGLLLGRPFYDLAAEVLMAKNIYIKMPLLSLFDYIGVISLLVVFVNLWFDIKRKELFIKKMWVFIYGTTAFLLYLFVGILTKSSYAFEGAYSLWSLLIPVTIAFAFLALSDVLSFIFGSKNCGYAICILGLAAIFFCFPQKPVISERMEYGSNVAQYFRISKEFRPTQWMIVSWKEGYPISLGNGFHMMIDEFIDKYNPEYYKLFDISGDVPEVLDTEDIFIFYEKNVFYSKALSNTGEYTVRCEAKPEISDWIERYRRNHNNISLFYFDDNIEVWRIHQQMDREEMRSKLWQE